MVVHFSKTIQLTQTGRISFANLSLFQLALFFIYLGLEMGRMTLKVKLRLSKQCEAFF
jgi:hypothetical protein